MLYHSLNEHVKYLLWKHECFNGGHGIRFKADNISASVEAILGEVSGADS